MDVQLVKALILEYIPPQEMAYPFHRLLYELLLSQKCATVHHSAGIWRRSCSLRLPESVKQSDFSEKMAWNSQVQLIYLKVSQRIIAYKSTTVFPKHTKSISNKTELHYTLVVPLAQTEDTCQVGNNTTCWVEYFFIFYLYTSEALWIKLIKAKRKGGQDSNCS